VLVNVAEVAVAEVAEVALTVVTVLVGHVPHIAGQSRWTAPETSGAVHLAAVSSTQDSGSGFPPHVGSAVVTVVHSAQPQVVVPAP